MAQNLFSQLKANMEFLSPVEQKLAQLILKEPERFISYTMTELAQLADVSQGSIINFSKKFSGGGFPALKLKVAGNLQHNIETPLTVVGNHDTVKDALVKNGKATAQAFKMTAEINSEETLLQVVTWILKAKKVEIYGIYRSAVVATDFYYQLLELGIPASFVSDILTCAVSAAMLDEESLVIAISSSGQTKEIIDAVKNAKANHVPVICLTSNGNSPLAKLADEVLIAASGGTMVGEAASEIRSSQLLLTDAVCSYLISKMNTEDQKRYLQLKKILNSHSVNE